MHSGNARRDPVDRLDENDAQEYEPYSPIFGQPHRITPTKVSDIKPFDPHGDFNPESAAHSDDF